jgi:hypothetical protein
MTVYCYREMRVLRLGRRTHKESFLLSGTDIQLCIFRRVIPSGKGYGQSRNIWDVVLHKTGIINGAMYVGMTRAAHEP